MYIKRVMQKILLGLLVLAMGFNSLPSKATKYLKKPISGGTDNAILKMGTDADSPTQVVSGITIDDSDNLTTNANVTVNGDLLTSQDVGTVGNGSTVTAIEHGNDASHVTTLTLANFVLPAVPGQGAQGNGALLYTLPAGAQLVQGARINVSIFADNGQVATDTPDVGIGSVIAAGAVSVLSGTATFEDILTGQTFNDFNGTAENTIVGLGTPFATTSGGTKTIYLNYADTFANGSNLHANGTVAIPWIHTD